MEEISKEVYQLVADNIAAECEKKGIRARFAVKTAKNYRGEPYTYIASTDFKVTPMIVKRINVEAQVWSALGITYTDKTLAQKMKGKQTVVADLRYVYDLQEGGYNGHRFGRIFYGIDNTQTDPDKMLIYCDPKLD